MSGIFNAQPVRPTGGSRCRRFARLWLALPLLCFCLSVRGDIATPTFESANKLYEEGKFGDAALAYEKLAGAGQSSAALYFNLGNAFLRAGQIGRAIAAYRQAGRITPRDPDVRAKSGSRESRLPSGPSSKHGGSSGSADFR